MISSPHNLGTNTLAARPHRAATSRSSVRRRAVQGASSSPSWRTFFETLERRILFSSEAGELIDLAAGTSGTQTEAELIEEQPASTSSSTFVGPIQYPSTGGSTPVPLPDGGTENSTTQPRPTSDFRYILRPGPGWTGPTPQPAPVGDPSAPGYDAKSIARWDVVPYQTFDDIFHVGVVAFHMNGIDRVDFSVNGGDWVAVRQITKNPQTDVYEYTATLRAADFPDGPLEVRAIAWPTTGEARVVDSLPLFANPNGSLTAGSVYVSLTGSDTAAGTRQDPFRTLSKGLAAVPDGGSVVLLDEGTYTLGDRGHSTYRANQRWITVKADAGLNRDNVIIASPNGIDRIRTRAFLVRWEGITLDLQSTWQYTPEPGDHVWFDQSKWTYNGWENTIASNGSQYPTPVKEWRGGLYVTDSVAYDVFYGFTLSDLTRNSHVERCSGDAFQSSRLVINSTASYVDGSISSHHTDLFQYFGDVENVIVYGFEAMDHIRAQSIFLVQPSIHADKPFKNFAFVDVTIRNTVNANGIATYFSQWGDIHDHTLYKNVRLLSQKWRFQSTYNPHNVVFRDCEMESGSYEGLMGAPPMSGRAFEGTRRTYPVYAPVLVSPTAPYSFTLTHALDEAAVSVMVIGPGGTELLAAPGTFTNVESRTVRTYTIQPPPGGFVGGTYVVCIQDAAIWREIDRFVFPIN